MDFELIDFVAVALGYGLPMAAWVVLTRRFSATWVTARPVSFAQPRRELGWGLFAASLVIAVNVLYNLGWLVPKPEDGWRGAVFLVNLAIIWSPAWLTLILRRQGPASCLMSPSGLGRKLVWSLGAGVLAMLTYLMVQGRELALLVSALGGLELTSVVQGLVQFCGFGFLLTRLVAASGRLLGSLICGLLYGLVKYPLYVSQYGMGFVEATVMIAFAAIVAAAAIYLVCDRQDLLVPAGLHLCMDQIQSV